MALILLCRQQLQETASFFAQSSYEHLETCKKKINKTGQDLEDSLPPKYYVISSGSWLKQIRNPEKCIFTPRLFIYVFIYLLKNILI